MKKTYYRFSVPVTIVVSVIFTNIFQEELFELHAGITNVAVTLQDPSSLDSEKKEGETKEEIKARSKQNILSCVSRYRDVREEILGDRKFNYKIEFITSDFQKEDTAIGRCYVKNKNSETKPRKVYLRRDFVYNASKRSVCSLVYHELGHCDLNLLHNDKDNIMNPTLKQFSSYLELDQDMARFMELFSVREND